MWAGPCRADAGWASLTKLLIVQTGFSGPSLFFLISSALVLVGCISSQHRTKSPSSDRTVVVYPFEVAGSGSAADAGLGYSQDLVRFLSHQPSSRINAQVGVGRGNPELEKLESGRYAILGKVDIGQGEVLTTAKLIETTSGDVLGQEFSISSEDLASSEVEITAEIYRLLLGDAAEKAVLNDLDPWLSRRPSSSEYANYLAVRNANASSRQELWKAALAKSPKSQLLKVGLAWEYVQAVQEERSANTAVDIEQAWALAVAARSAEMSKFAELEWYRIMAYLYQWHEGDFDNANKAARKASALVPRDLSLKIQLADVLTNGGSPEEAIEWLMEARRGDLNKTQQFGSSLAWAYLIADRPEAALEEYLRVPDACRLCLAVTYVRLGQIEKARSIVAEFRSAFPAYTLSDEATWPSYQQPQMAEPYLTDYLRDLRTAGLREK
jgi:tetratricopeptide (TPR) repeat protein